MQSAQCEVTWNNLELSTVEGNKIVSNASGQIRPYTLTAILGPSGSGKTSLLNSLAGRINSDQILSGDIKANGENRDDENWSKTVAYVGQSFHAYEWQTVYETLEFVAKIKIPSHKKVEHRVNELIDILGLTGSKNTFIGKLSGGEKMRVSIGLELLGDPLVLLVDEPLSGLDSYNAVNILDILRKISDMGTTVLVTIHQPSYMMMNYFDRIMLMCKGSTVYEGTLDECIKFFEECGFELPKNTTPTDFFLATLSIDHKNDTSREESIKRINTIKREWNFIKPEHETTIHDKLVLPIRAKSTLNIRILLSRFFKNYIRNTQYLKSKLFQKVFIATFFGLTFYNSGLEGSDIFSFRGIISFVFQTELFGVSNPIMNAFIEEKKIISRECKSGIYTGYEVFFAKFIAESIFNSMIAIPYHLFVYFLIGFPFNFMVLARFYLIIFCVINYSVSFGLTVGTLAKSTQAAQVIGTTLNVTFMLYSGSFSNPKILPRFVKNLVWLSPVHYGFRALVINQVSSLPYILTDVFNKVSNPRTIVDFGLEGMGVYMSISILILITLCFQQIGAYILYKRSNNNLKIKKTEKQQV